MRSESLIIFCQCQLSSSLRCAHHTRKSPRQALRLRCSHALHGADVRAPQISSREPRSASHRAGCKPPTVRYRQHSFHCFSRLHSPGSKYSLETGLEPWRLHSHQRCKFRSLILYFTIQVQAVEINGRFGTQICQEVDWRPRCRNRCSHNRHTFRCRIGMRFDCF